MKETEVKKRGWVKNAVIIFLAVMLALTFFSNTIMNRSLPEVAAQYTNSGNITARIRGTGTVTANERFDVEFGHTRRVTEVPVRKGDEVNIGDVLVRLTGAESKELEEAKIALRTAETALDVELLEASRGSGVVADAARAVQSARNALTDAQLSLSDAQRVQSGTNYNEAAYNAALAANNQAQAVVNQAQNEFLTASAVTSARQYDLSIATAELNALGPSPEDGGTVDPIEYDAAVQKVRAAQFEYDIVKAASDAAGNAVTAAELAAAAPNAEYSLQSQNREAWISANTSVRIANSAVRDAQVNLDAANANLSLVQAGESVDGSLDSLKLSGLRKDLEEAKEKVEELEKEGQGTEIISPVGGIITDVNVTVNKDTDPDEPLMVIEVVDRGYSINFRVTAEQASRVNVGDQAEVDRGWWGQEEIRATLIGIRNDPQTPATNRILHFSISGDVQTGDQLNLILNQRTENYNIIVPNSAIRTDTNGDFVLVVMSRPNPLGNRYIATRVDVNILATDDTHSAIAGAGLTGWDFVITTSTAPIDPGMQVRLVDNP